MTKRSNLFPVVLCHVAFAVFVGIECARIYVVIGRIFCIDAISTCFKQAGERCGDNTLPSDDTTPL